MSGEAWKDFEHFINYYVPKQTVPRLRQFAAVIEKHARMRLILRSQERKADVVHKIQVAFQTMKNNDQVAIYQAARAECEQIGAGHYSAHSHVLPPPTFGTVTAANSAARYHNAMSAPTNGYPAPNGSGWRGPAVAQASSSGREPTLIDWKPSPMWKPLKALTNMEALPDIHTSESSHVRREKRVIFSLPNDVIDGLNKSKSDPHVRPVYSVRLFCTSSEYFRPPGMYGQPGQPVPTNRNVPIEYPANPDVVVDGHVVPFKARGLRGKAGSAPPLDLDKSSRGLVRTAGRMASMIMAHQGPTPSKKKEYSKKFFFQVVYCEFTSMEDLLTRLEGLAPTDPEAELAKLRQRAAEDDDIEVGTSTLSLKDPLSGMRITKPIRSVKCSHLQCFDARWWLESNKTHPQWLCPHCSKELDFESIICDGYFLSILRAVPDTFDEVTLEPNGEWHTQNNQYGSIDWLAEHGAAPPATSAAMKRPRSDSPNGVNVTPGKRRAIEILSDSDDDDDSETPQTSLASGRASGYSSTNHNSRAISHSVRSTASVQPPAIIDLTLSSDEDTDDEEQLHFHQPGGSSTSREGAGSSGVRPATETVTHATWSPKRPVTTPTTQASPSSNTVPTGPRVTLRFDPRGSSNAGVSAPGVYGGSSGIRTSSHQPASFSSEGLSSAQILQAADRFGPRAGSSSSSSARPNPNAPEAGLTAAQIMAAAERFGPRPHASSNPPPPSMPPNPRAADSAQPQARYSSTYRPPPRPPNGYSHYS
ncbi:hypothetical protein CC85DRAFT_325947 [Cutaneotrichosporon oleaginosum]|uniref:SP-RING-type domain-containing protein n=1 Tax=Cutaneotrichosporon oleaginosum TaxID=879819 RepID=A0A0J0XVE5_9TREE|nr:uncharacterized protein CC85DRAFT_325947 [Cutaneotrichosporon oleaginosum]KLT45028.1 hypothetical protein CC85DRAFT_325947 [Cutaneotrichosporon oleaginosum]TXT09715.1 hypothetical protein COLE_03649 [Cutaneotrichosporon oleaginosum]